MKKTIIVFIIAIVLVSSIVGTCFALYKKNATSKTIEIDAIAGDGFSLTLSETGTISRSAFSPESRSHSFKVTLGVTGSKNHSGIFKVSVTGALTEYLDITVKKINSLDDNDGETTASATTATGTGIALSNAPQYYLISLYLNDEGVSNFTTVAEKQSTITVNWDVDEDTVNFDTYDSNAYYVVGLVNGVDRWYPTKNSHVLSKEDIGGNVIAKVENVALKAGDSFKVVWNFFQENEQSWWYGDGNNNVTVSADGTYTIILYNDNGYKVRIE